MILGAHESTQGGLPRAFERAARDQALCVQMWLKSSRQWQAQPLEVGVVQQFKQARLDHGFEAAPLAAHASYLINLATPDEAMRAKSTQALIDECLRAEALGVESVIFHPGSALDGDIAAGIHRTGACLAQVFDLLHAQNIQARPVLEITAGQGHSVGCSFEHLAQIVDHVGEASLGVCLDTQHMWAAGIDWASSDAAYEATFKDFEQRLGLARLRAFHLNDSKKALGSRVDRHDIIGEGLIPLQAFGRLIKDSRFTHIPGYLETPPLESGEDSYKLCLERLRALI